MSLRAGRKRSPVAAGLGTSIYQTRVLHGLSLVQMASRMKVQVAKVQRWERTGIIDTMGLLHVGAIADGYHKDMIVEELRHRFAQCPLIRVVG